MASSDQNYQLGDFLSFPARMMSSIGDGTPVTITSAGEVAPSGSRTGRPMGVAVSDPVEDEHGNMVVPVAFNGVVGAPAKPLIARTSGL